jgi:hypothetical protein
MTMMRSGDLTVERRCATSIIVPAPPQPTTGRGTRLPRGRRAGGLVQQQDARVTVQAPGQWERWWLGWGGGAPPQWVGMRNEADDRHDARPIRHMGCAGESHSPRDGDALLLVARQRGAPPMGTVSQSSGRAQMNSCAWARRAAPPPPHGSHASGCRRQRRQQRLLVVIIAAAAAVHVVLHTRRGGTASRQIC